MEHIHHHITSWQNVLRDIPGDFWEVLTEMAPFLLLGFLMAGLLSVLISPKKVARHLGRRGLLSTFKAAMFGVPLPLCSCSVIPVSASLRRSGASKGATTAFLISAPETGVDSILVTYSLLGLVFAIFRPVAALISGIIGGIFVDLLDRKEGLTASAGVGEGVNGSGQSEGEASVKHGRIYRAIEYAFFTLPGDIGKSLLVGVAIAALITALLPPSFFTDTLGGVMGGGVLGILIMMMLGVPVYVCATASVPIAAALIVKGVSPGAALAFLMTGPATNAATIATIWKVMGKRTALAYLLTIMGASLASGLLLDYIFAFKGAVAYVPDTYALLPGWLTIGSAVVLLAILAYAVGKPILLRKRLNVASESPAAVLAVTGMTCQHCLETVRKALLSCTGVKAVDVNLKAGQARVYGSDLDVNSLNAVVKRVGYNSQTQVNNR